MAKCLTRTWANESSWRNWEFILTICSVVDLLHDTNIFQNMGIFIKLHPYVNCPIKADEIKIELIFILICGRPYQEFY